MTPREMMAEKTAKAKPGLMCPATMCPLFAPDGSPWSGEKDAPCPAHDNLDTDGCPWWGMACATCGVQAQVEEAAEDNGRMMVVGPSQPRREGFGSSRSYDCPKASVCRWQEIAEIEGRQLCPPRDALARGMDPRVCAF